MEPYPMKWFRLYTEVLNDIKVQQLPAEAFKQWVNLLCLANKGKPRGRINPSDIPYELRLTESQAGKMVEYFLSRDLLTWEDGMLVPNEWDNRQFESDNVTERVKKHRSNVPRNRNETLHETLHETLDGTPPDTDTDTDTEITPLYPPKGKRNGQRTSWDERWVMNDEWIHLGESRGVDPHSEFVKFKNYWLAEGKTKADWLAAWRLWLENAKDFSRPGKNGKGERYYTDGGEKPLAEENVKEAAHSREASRIFRELREVGLTGDILRAQHARLVGSLVWEDGEWKQTQHHHEQNESAPGADGPSTSAPLDREAVSSAPSV